MRLIRSLTAACLAFGFLLGIHEGKLTLWREGQQQPEQVYDVRADTLPPADRLILERGMHLETRRELWKVLENYLE